MRRALWTADGLEVTDVAPGPVPEGRVRLQVTACGICGSDLHWWHGSMPRPIGSAPGHELAITARYPHQAAAAAAMGVTVEAEEDGIPWAKDRGADVVVESVGGTAPTLDQAVTACRKAGTVVLLGMFTDDKTSGAIKVTVLP